MLHAIVFSHRRQYQLHACLESLLFYVQPAEVTVIYGAGNDYREIEGHFPKVHFCQDNPFDTTLREEVDALTQPLVMFCVDDLVFVRHVCDVDVMEHFYVDDKLLGFSLRLSDYLPGAPADLCWDWTKRKSYQYGTGWGYPFELSGMIYRREAVDSVMTYSIHHQPIKGPNHFEAIGYSCGTLTKWPRLMRRGKCSVIGAHVNSVQTSMEKTREVRDIYPPEMLDELYLKGNRLNWKKIRDPIHSTLDTRSIYWHL